MRSEIKFNYNKFYCSIEEYCKVHSINHLLRSETTLLCKCCDVYCILEFEHSKEKCEKCDASKICESCTYRLKSRIEFETENLAKMHFFDLILG